MRIDYREIISSDKSFFNEMLYEAIFVEKGKPKLPRLIIKDPSIAKYTQGFGTLDLDIGIVALYENKPIGVIWGRAFSIDNKGYGFIHEDIPEIRMAIQSEFRNKGIGTELLCRIEVAYRKLGVTALSLSVDKKNPAKRLYQRNGYLNYSEKDGAITMKKNI
ncbi:GNAT family N-acetyltransferase [bacterium SCSIO 12643]|nr:GNAT family N-acetyltransferase [bacterium SCSIO 12643]